MDELVLDAKSLKTSCSVSGLIAMTKVSSIVNGLLIYLLDMFG
jgi:hypothetical protein